MESNKNQPKFEKYYEIVNNQELKNIIETLSASCTTVEQVKSLKYPKIMFLDDKVADEFDEAFRIFENNNPDYFINNSASSLFNCNVVKKFRKVSLVVAMSTNNVIGIYDSLPWSKLKKDMKHFKETTTGNIVIVGGTTWETFGKRPLPNRINIIISTRSKEELLNPEYNNDNVYIAKNLLESMLIAETCTLKDDVDIYIIGGSTIYDQFLNSGTKFVDELIITRVDTIINPENPGNVYFPDYKEFDWLLDNTTSHKADENNDHNFSIDYFVRAPKTLTPDAPL